MKPELQIKALAKLDGHYAVDVGLNKSVVPGRMWPTDIPDYLTSYDAIIPLIQKQLGFAFFHAFLDALGFICAEQWSKDEGEQYEYQGDGSYFESWLHFRATPSQLAEALLRATNKWIEL